MQNCKITVRFVQEKDINALYDIFKMEPFEEGREKFQAYYEQSQQNVCIFALAELDKQVCSMVSAHFQPAQYAPPNLTVFTHGTNH
jgi:hypothetical protein